MQDFFQNVSRYPTYLISLILGIFLSFFGRFAPLMKNPFTATALIGAVLGSIAFIFFTLRAMLGLTPV